MKVDIISGFLGAGKTTLIQLLMKELYSQEKILIIENEFGEIGIDSAILRSKGYELRELNSGCICCTINGDFKKVIKKIVQEVSVDRIVIEPSGVAKLSDVIMSLDELEIDRKIVVIDGMKFPLYFRNFQSFFKDQIKEANIIFINRKNEAKLPEILSEIKFLNPNTVIYIDEWNTVFTNEIKNKKIGSLNLNPKNIQFYSKIVNFNTMISQDEFKELLNKLQQKKYLRAKGIVHLDSNIWKHFEYTLNELKVEDIQAQQKSGYVIIDNKEIVL